MILYTTMPLELVYPIAESEFAKRKTVNYEGISLIVEQDEDHAYRVIQVLSTNPAHFLDTRFQPGAKISLS